MEITISNRLYLSRVPASFQEMVKAKLTIGNPEYLDLVKMNRWTGNTPEKLFYYEDMPDGLGVPRGYARQLIELCRAHRIQYDIIDQRRTLSDMSFTSSITLRDYQEDAVNEVLKRDFGVLESPTGSGKTVMALAVIEARRQPTLIIVHNKELLSQWIDRINSFMGMSKHEIGIIGAGQNIIGDRITVGIVNSVYKHIDQIKEKIGFLIVDECRRCPSRTFTEAVKNFDCRYMLGLSATPWRRDRLTRVIYFHLGDRVHQVEKAELHEAGAILKANVIKRETLFTTQLNVSKEYSRVLSELTLDPLRNALIVEDVVDTTLTQGGTSLVLTDRKDHCMDLSNRLFERGIENEVLIGDLPIKKREFIVEKLNQGRVKVLLATGQLVGEGFDSNSLSTLFLACPIKFSGRLIQYLGRVLRPAPGKCRALVYDYVDSRVPVLKASARARERVYHG